MFATDGSRATVTVDLGAIKKNYAFIRSLIAKGCKICAMVKGDAYGHGMVAVSKALEECGASYLGVADISEALELRAAGVRSPILMMGYTPVCDMPKLCEYGLTQTVFSREYAGLLSENLPAAVKCHLKLDTGMSRLGFVCPDGKATGELLEALRLPKLDYEGVFTHFACSDEPDEKKTRAQFDNFMAVIADAEKNGVKFKIRHCANSGAILHFPDMQLDMVRPGILLYGLSPDGGKNPDLAPAMSLSGSIELVKTVPAGRTVSYGGVYHCERDTRIAVVSLGYADGVSRALAPKGCVTVNGKRAKIIGKICMDHFMIDAAGLGEIPCGTPAYIFGGPGDAISADEVAENEGTISYEVLCRMVGRRVIKRFIG